MLFIYSTITFDFNLNVFSFTARRIHAIVFKTARTKSAVLHVQFNDSKLMFPSASEQFKYWKMMEVVILLGNLPAVFPYDTSLYQFVSTENSDSYSEPCQTS